MELNLIFASDFGVRGLGEGSLFSGSDSFCLYSPEGRSLVFRARSTGWQPTEVSGSLGLESGEAVKALQVSGAGEGLVLTSRHRILRLKIADLALGAAEFSSVEFRCGAGVPKNSKMRFWQEGRSIFLIAGHMVFSLAESSLRFSLLKVLGEEIIDVARGPAGEMLVSTSRRVHSLTPRATEKGWTCETRVLLQTSGGLRAVAACGGRVFALGAEGLLEAGEEIEGRLILAKLAFGPETPESLATIEGTLVALGPQYAQVLDNPSNPPRYALPISHFAMLATDDRIISLGSEPKLTLSIGNLRKVSVPKDEMVQRFIERGLEERLSLVFAFLAQKFFEGRESLGKNPNGIVQILLEELNLSPDLLRHPRFRPNSIRFFKLVKAFLPSETRSLSKKYSLEGPLNPPPKSREPLATLPDENSETGGNRPTQALKPSRNLPHRACSQEKEKPSNRSSQTFCLPIQGDREPIASESN